MTTRKLLPEPTSWVDREQHLIEEHGMAELIVDNMDSLTSRVVHRELHRTNDCRHGHIDW